MKKSNDKSQSKRSIFRDEGDIKLNDNNVEQTNDLADKENASSGTKTKSKRNKIVTVLLDLAIVACLVIAAVLIITPIMRGRRQDEIMKQLASLMEEDSNDNSDVNLDLDTEDEDVDLNDISLSSGEIVKVDGGYLVDAHANAIAGEEYEDFGQDFEDIAEPVSDTFLLEPMGMLQIPKEGVEINLPLLKGATHVPLRYGAGWYQSSAQIGEQGRATILGHTMAYGNDRFFTKLINSEVSDTIRIVESERILTYEIYDIKIVEQSELQGYLINNEVDSEIMLVTCNHNPVYGRRLLVFASLVDVEMVDANN